VILDRVTPYLSAALSTGPNGIQVAIDHTVLSWEHKRLRLVADGVHLVQPQSQSRLTFRRMEVQLSLRALLFGTLAPSYIALDQPDLRLERAPDGALRLALGSGAETPEAGEFFGGRLTADLAQVPNREGPLGYLNEFDMTGATLTVDDRSLGVTWSATDVDLTMHRSVDGLEGQFHFSAGIGGKPAVLNGRVSYRRNGEMSVILDFNDVVPAVFAQAAPALSPLGALDLPVSGEMALGLDTDSLEISVAFANLTFGKGTIHNDDLPAKSVAVAGGILRASYDPGEGQVNLDHLELDLGGPKAIVEGTVLHIGKDLLAGGWPQNFDVAAKLAMTKVEVDEFPHLWPARVGALTRTWVVNHAHDGIVDQFDAAMAFHVDTAAAKPIQVTSLDGTASFHDLTIEYFPGLEPCRGIDGTATFDRKQVVFLPVSGNVLGAKATGGTVRLYDLDTNDEMADVDVDAEGPLADVLEVLDTKPLEYAKALGLDAAHAQGRFTTHMFFELPLKHDLALDQVVYRTEAQLTDVAVPHALFERDLAAGAFKLTLDRSALEVDGSAELGGAPSKIDWTESFGKDAHRHYAIHAQTDDASRQKLGLDFGSYADIKGPVAVDLIYDLLAKKQAHVAVMADLKAAAVEIPDFGLGKAAGTPATAKFALDLDGDNLSAIRDATLTGEGIDARLSARFDKSGTLERLDAPRLKGGWTDAALTAERAGKGYKINVSGASYDVAGMMKDVSRTPSGSTPPPLAIDVKLGSVVLGEQREVKNVIANLQSDGPHWTQAAVDGVLGERRRLTARFGGDNGPGKFTLKADDFGALLKLLDVTDNIDGGSFAVTGNAVDIDGKRVLKGTADAADYRVVRAPLFAKVLQLTSFTGVGNLLSGEGIPFKALEGEFVYGAGSLQVSNLRAYGGAIGVNVDGRVDYDAGTLDASGTLVPANILNTVIGNIPVIGNLLLGGEGQGIFGANFRIAGPIADPQIAVNPLSALAPGVLRKLFLFKVWNPSSGTPAPAKPPETSAPPHVAPAPQGDP